MKTLLVLLTLVIACIMIGCDNPGPPLPDTSTVKKTMPPGWKSKDVQIHIDK